MSVDLAVSPYVLGIDLGTTNSSASIYVKGSTDTLKVDGDNLSMPSVVRFVDRKIDNVQVGRMAKPYILINPDQVFSSVKSLMRNDDWEKETDVKTKFNIDGQQLTPVDIAAEVLKKLVDDVHTNNETDGEIQKAVICVPANTTDEYRLNVFKAAQSAGLGLKDENGDLLLDEAGHPQGVFLLEEPTAAAISYGEQLGLLSKEKEQQILVYDLGGGTFDVTILHIDSTDEDSQAKFTVKASNGIAKLGGDDFDRVIMEMCSEKFQEESEIDIFDTSSDQKATSGKALKEAQQKLKLESERVKIEMAGGLPRTEISIINFLKDGEGDTYNLEVEIKRNDFLERIQPLLDDTIDTVNNALSEGSMTMDDINRIILVGGSTKADWIFNTIKEKLGKEPYRAENVDVIVSQGASLYGANLPTWATGEPGEDPQVVVNNTTLHHLGIELQGQKFGLVIPKGLPLDDDHPTQTITKEYGNPHNSDTVVITVWKTNKTIEMDEGEPTAISYVNETNEQGGKIFDCIGEFSLRGIPIKPEGTEKIEVTMEVDRNNLLKVSAKIASSGASEGTELSVSKK